MMSKLFVLFIGLIGYCSTSSLSGKDKFESLCDKQDKDNGLISIAGYSFEKYITRGPRPYFSLIILTALKSGSCKPCEEIHPEIIKLSESIKQQTLSNEDNLNLDASNELRNIFVMKVDFIENRETFKKLSLNTAPLILLVPPSKTKKEIPLKNFLKYLGAKYQYSLTKGRSSKDILEWIKNTGKNSGLIWLKSESSNKFDINKLNLKLILPGIFMLPIILYYFKAQIDKLRTSMILYSIVAIAVYGFVIGGGMFPIIRSTPWHHIEKGKISYISHMARYQFGAEGYIIGFANVFAGLSVFIYINKQRFGSNNSDKRLRFVKWLPLWAPIGVILVAWYVIMYCYNFKNGHYNFGHVGMTG